MKITADTIEKLITASGEKSDTLREIDRLIVKTASGLKRQLFSTLSITMLGYGEMEWRKSADGVIWPLIGVAPQKNYISIYIAGEKDGVPLPHAYKDLLGKISHQSMPMTASIRDISRTDIFNILNSLSLSFLTHLFYSIPRLE